MHYSVLLNESIDGLNIKSDGIYVDATLGYGGHSEAILKKLTDGYLIAFDSDQEAIDYSRDRLSKISNNFKLIHSNFENMKSELNELGITKVDGIVFDLGFSSPQIDDESRGFSFQKDARLDMRMNKEQKLSAYEVVNNYKVEELTDIFYRYAEEKYSKAIAKRIVERRPINTTLELVDAILSSVPTKYANTRHPERVIFQAIRIEVNRELKVLESVLPDAIELLNEGGRISVITFHSLEDRIVKNYFKELSYVDPKIKGMPNIPANMLPDFEVIKGAKPTKEEIEYNRRSRSARLRIIERIK